MSRQLAVIAVVGVLAAGCGGGNKTATPPADMNGVWFGWWENDDVLAPQQGNGFYLTLSHDRDAETVSGSAFSAVSGPGTVTGTSDGSRFELAVSYENGDVETLDGREVFGEIKGGDYEGTLGGVSYEGDMDMIFGELARQTNEAASGGVSGRILTNGGTQPLVGAKVSIGVGSSRQETFTNGSGTYNFPFVAGGARVLVVTAIGGSSAFVPIVVNGSTTLPDINIVPSGSNPSVLPTITLDPGPDGAIVFQGETLLSGSVTQLDAGLMVASVNGNEFLVPLDAGNFDYGLILQRGINKVILQTANQQGFTERGVITYAEVPTRKIRVTLTWDEGRSSPTAAGTDNDVNLHVWFTPPGGGGFTHAGPGAPAAITGGEIDVPNDFGYGPEAFTMNLAAAGRYYFAAQFTEGSIGPNVFARVSLNEKTADDRIYVLGPVYLNAPDSSPDFPVTTSNASWWRMVDLDVSSTGVVTLASGQNPDTSVQLPQ